jgi:hypothetical protein
MTIEKTVPIFCTLSWQRSGTKFLGSCLKKGTAVKSFGEVFNPSSPSFVNYFNWIKSRLLPAGTDPRSEPLYDEFFQTIISQYGTSHFDLMLNQLYGLTPAWSDTIEPFFLDFAKARGFWFILVTRPAADIFRSIEILKRSGVAHSSTSSVEKLDIAPFEICRNQYLEFERRLSHYYGLVRSCLSSYPRFIEISFEELTGSSGFLPPRLIDYIDSAIRSSLDEAFVPLVQLQPSTEGRSPIVPPGVIVNSRDITSS